jgi:hypothetical protein
VAKSGRWVARLVVRLRANPDFSQNYKMGEISKGEANTLLPAKKICKKLKMLRTSLYLKREQKISLNTVQQQFLFISSSFIYGF